MRTRRDRAAVRRAVCLALISLGATVSYAVDTTIKGGRMELLDKGTTILFKGGVTLHRGEDVLKANEMKTTNRRDKVEATGNVRLLRTLARGETVRATGRRGFYDTKTGEGYLVSEGEKQAHVIYRDVSISTSPRRVDIFADRIDFARAANEGVATGDVKGDTTDPATGEKVYFWADKAVYRLGDRQIVLTGATQPRVQQHTAAGKRQISGETIIYYIDSRRMIADGDAEAWFVEKDDGETE